MAHKKKGSWRLRVQQDKQQNQSQDQPCEKPATTEQSAEEPQPHDQKQPQQSEVPSTAPEPSATKGKRKAKGKRSHAPNAQSDQPQESQVSLESQAETPAAALEEQEGKAKAKSGQAPPSPSHQKESVSNGPPQEATPAAVGAPPPPVPAAPRRKLKIWMRLCSTCTDKGSFCSAALCPAYQRGQCEKGKDGNTCAANLCHSCEGNHRVRNVPKGKNGKKSIAMQEHQTKTLFVAHGYCFKNTFFDTVDSPLQASQRQRDHSTGPDRSKDPFWRTNCHHCLNDAKQKSKRTEGVLDGRVLTLLVTGMRSPGPQKLDTTWMEEKGDPATNPLLPEMQEESQLLAPIPSYTLATFRKELNRSRDSGGLFDPLGLTPMCQKVLCKHWLRGDCKSQRETCKFAHCHVGGFELKPGSGNEDDVQSIVA